MDKQQMVEQLEDELYQKTTGDRTFLTVTPGGSRDGLDYGPAGIEIVVLDHDGQTIAYRYSDDALDADWSLGSIEDAVTAATEAEAAASEVARFF